MDRRRIVSSRPLGPGLRIKAALALKLQLYWPSLYRLWAVVGARRWHRDEAPWTPVDKPLDQCRVALISSGGIIAPGQQPFDLSNPAGDCSYRIIPDQESLKLLRVSHVFYDSDAVHDDVEVLFPIATLQRLAVEGLVGSVAPRHFSLSGSIPDPSELVSDTGPEIAAILTADEVNLVLLVPA